MKDFPTFFGKVPVGTKGQIVIPAEARRELKIKPGDSVIVISGSPQRRTISILPEEEFNKFLKFFDHMAGMRHEFSGRGGK
ncbi:MAG: AbrB/MazE/SpoVT family DNA-binding domain-containing protein [Candidatus Omnitrophota bacterium]